MVEGCGPRAAKYTLCIFNILVLLAGLAVAATGIWLLADENASKYFDIIRADTSDGLVKGACIVFIIVGFVAGIIAFMGCCGAVRESSCLLQTYAITLSLILLLQIAAGIAAIVFRDDINKNLENSMNSTIQYKYGRQDQSGLTEAWDFMQIEFKCCGSTVGPTEWLTSSWYNSLSNQTVPDSCCVLINNDVDNPIPVNRTACYLAADNINTTDASNYVHTEGCSQSFHDWFKSHIAIIIGIAFGLAVIQIAAIIMACYLKKEVSNKNYFA